MNIIARRLHLLALALLSAVPAARAEIVDLAWDGHGRVDHVTTLAPGKFLELCGPLARGQSIAWSFKAERLLDFNIHYHVGDQVVTPAERKGVAAMDGRLDVKLDQSYCWMWSNKSQQPTGLLVKLAR
jgi:hypothetical protein